MHKRDTCKLANVRRFGTIYERKIVFTIISKFFTQKGLNATEIHKELDNVYKDSAPSYRIVAKWLAEFKNPEGGFENVPRSDRPLTTVTDENI